jgi:hypothetical protein
MDEEFPGLEALATRLEEEYGAMNDTPSDRAGTRMRGELAAWARGLLARARAEEESLRRRFSDLGDRFNRERAARQALLYTANDLRENAILEIEHALGQRITPARMEALADALRPVLEEHDCKLKTWGTRATMRLSFGRALAVQALEDALGKLKGRPRRG